jgi:hypothetical protein
MHAILVYLCIYVYVGSLNNWMSIKFYWVGRVKMVMSLGVQ